MSYRPITDMWILARCNWTKYYGAYPGGFPERARRLLGVTINDPVLHVCGGKIKDYPYKGAFGPYDKTLDLDPEMNPDFLRDARDPFPSSEQWCDSLWPAILMDPPYTPQDAEHYTPGADKFPEPGPLLRNALEVLRPGGRVGLIHYFAPTCPKNASFIACVGVFTGFNNRIRCYSVYEKNP